LHDYSLSLDSFLLFHDKNKENEVVKIYIEKPTPGYSVTTTITEKESQSMAGHQLTWLAVCSME
jgi:hypothetical protein